MNQSNYVSPIFLITDYYDSLVNQIDIYTETLLNETNSDKLLPEPKGITSDEPNEEIKECFGVEEYNDPYSEHYPVEKLNCNNTTAVAALIPASKRVHDYANETRARILAEIEKAQGENLEYYKSNRDKFEYDANKMDKSKIEELRAKLFAKKFCFLIKIEKIGDVVPVFKYFAIVTDFYPSPSQIEAIKYVGGSLVTYEIKNEKYDYWNAKGTLNEEILVAHLMVRFLEDKFRASPNFGNELVRINLASLLSINKIKLRFPISSSVHIKVSSKYNFSNVKSFELFGNNLSLKRIELCNLEYLRLCRVELESKCLDQMPNLVKLSIQNCHINDLVSKTIRLPRLKVLEMDFNSNFCNRTKMFSLKEFPSLAWLYVKRVDLTDSDFDFLKTLHNQLVVLDFCFPFKDFICAPKLNCLFETNEFPVLRKLGIHSGNWGFYYLDADPKNKTNHKFNARNFDNMRNLRELNFSLNSTNTIEPNSFASLRHLRSLGLDQNTIERLDNPDVFNGLDNLEYFDLTDNDLRWFDPSIFDKLPNLKEIKITRQFERNYVENLESIKIVAQSRNIKLI